MEFEQCNRPSDEIEPIVDNDEILIDPTLSYEQQAAVTAELQFKRHGQHLDDRDEALTHDLNSRHLLDNLEDELK
jgi:hypothetical protein